MKKLLAMVCSVMLLCGCGARTANRAGILLEEDPLDGMERAYLYDREEDIIGVDDAPVRTAADGRSVRLNAERLRKARDIEASLKALPWIEDCGVIINGDRAVVGLMLPGEPKGEAATRAKKDVRDRVLAMEPGLSHVSVTSVPELFGRIAGTRGSKEVGARKLPMELFPMAPAP